VLASAESPIPQQPVEAWPLLPVVCGAERQGTADGLRLLQLHQPVGQHVLLHLVHEPSTRHQKRLEILLVMAKHEVFL